MDGERAGKEERRKQRRAGKIGETGGLDRRRVCKTDASARQKTRRVWSKTGDAGQASPSVPLAHTSGPACTMAAREKWAARAHRPGRPAQFRVSGLAFRHLRGGPPDPPTWKRSCTLLGSDVP
jgi:hypothetical protein